MTREEAVAEIRLRWRDLYPKDSKKGIICPLCGSGSGGKHNHFTGITANENHGKPYSLRCWSCGFSGDILDLIQKDRGVDFNEAIRIAAQELNIPIDISSHITAREAFYPKSEENISKNEKMAESGSQAEKNIISYKAYYEECNKRLSEPEALSYLTERGISLDLANKYSLGYDSSWISPTVVRNSEAKGNNWKPPATRRIIIPVSDNHYIARAIDPGVEKQYEKMNETGNGESGIFNFNAINSGGEAVFICEGAFDALSIISAGAEAIALNSTSLVNKFIEMVKAIGTNKKIIICLDNDKPGREAADKLREGLTNLNIITLEANISGQYKDSNEALVSNREEFKKAVFAALEQAKAAELPKPKDELDLFREKIKTRAYEPLKTGLEFFDGLIGGGVIRQSLTILVAAPGTGKTTLCQQLSRTMAEKNKMPIIYLNLEMSREQMLSKDISAILYASKGARKSTFDILRGYQWNDGEEKLIDEVIEEYRVKVNPYLKYNPDKVGSHLESIMDYLTKTGEAAKRDNRQAPAVVVDYLHLITSIKKIDAQELLKEAVKAFKDYAIKYNTFVIAIAASGRASNKNGNMTLESARDSSNIEYTADCQISLNYLAIDSGNIKPSDTKKMERLLTQEQRQMILRVHKSRFSIPGRSKRVWFDAMANTFYTTRAKQFTDDIREGEDEEPQFEKAPEGFDFDSLKDEVMSRNRFSK